MQFRTGFFVGARYARSRGGNSFLSFMTWVSVLGLALGVVSLIVVVSVMNGFDSELKRRILGTVPHVTVTGPASVEDLRAMSQVAEVSRFSRDMGLVVRGRDNQLIEIYGIDPELEGKMSILPNHMYEGSVGRLTGDGKGIILGRPLSFRLGVTTGDSLTLIIPETAPNNSVTSRILHLELVGTFELGSELDYRLGFVHVDSVTSDRSKMTHRLTLHDLFQAPGVAGLLSAQPGLSTEDWTKSYGDFFRTVRMEKIMMFMLLTLIVAIAAFSIVSSLSMMVSEKKPDIAVLRTCGMSTRGVTQIFVVQGALIGFLGVGLGVALGLPLAYVVTDLVAWIESLVGAKMLAGTYFDSIPTDVRGGDIVIVVSVSFLISLLATIYPAYRAASVDPAAVLRYE